MSDPLAIYPWQVDTRAVAEILIGGAAAIAMLYLWLRAGRDRLDDSPTGEKAPVHDYAGIIQVGTNKMPTFLILFIIVISLIAICYIINVCLHHGLEY